MTDRQIVSDWEEQVYRNLFKCGIDSFDNVSQISLNLICVLLFKFNWKYPLKYFSSSVGRSAKVQLLDVLFLNVSLYAAGLLGPFELKELDHIVLCELTISNSSTSFFTTRQPIFFAKWEIKADNVISETKEKVSWVISDLGVIDEGCSPIQILF